MIRWLSQAFLLKTLSQPVIFFVNIITFIINHDLRKRFHESLLNGSGKNTVRDGEEDMILLVDLLSEQLDITIGSLDEDITCTNIARLHSFCRQTHFLKQATTFFMR